MTRRRWIADRAQGDRAFLLGVNADHLFRVLRAKPGQQFDIAADGVVRLGTILAASAEQVEFELGPQVESEQLGEVSVYLSVFKFDRMEWALEKLTELGVSRIHPVISSRTETHLARAAEKRMERWGRILHEAAQQSRRLSPPEISPPAALKNAIAGAHGCRIVLSEHEKSVSLLQALESCAAPVTLALGPEGGWTQQEAKLFHENEWVAASLGSTILRAETAAIAALAIVMSHLA
ncbi:MAG TPA: RsmE family RNA methyltransferase [Candidatus Angelobacter sp.]|nr:RsmE family RNA methyltransferase [Candidatus Angelobacter sp.]